MGPIAAYRLLSTSWQPLEAKAVAWYESDLLHALPDTFASAAWQRTQSLPMSEIEAWFIHCEVLLEVAEDRDLIFRFTVRDKGSIREVARGTQTRRIVLMEDFMRRVAQHRARVD